MHKLTQQKSLIKKATYTVIIAQIVSGTVLIITNKFLLCLIQCFIVSTKNTICAIKNGKVNNSLKTPINIASIL